jgi:amino acid efflux transporter
MVAALQLLPRWSAGWWMAVAAAVLCAGMLALAWASLTPALVLAATAAVVTLVRRARSRPV